MSLVEMTGCESVIPASGRNLTLCVIPSNAEGSYTTEVSDLSAPVEMTNYDPSSRPAVPSFCIFM